MADMQHFDGTILKETKDGDRVMSGYLEEGERIVTPDDQSPDARAERDRANKPADAKAEAKPAEPVAEAKPAEADAKHAASDADAKPAAVSTGK